MKKKKSIFNFCILLIVLVSMFHPVSAYSDKNMDQDKIVDVIFSPVNGYIYTSTGDKVGDANVYINRALFRNKKLIHVEGKLFLFNEIWVFYANNFKLLRDTWVAEALYVKHDNSKITTYGGNLAIERRGKVISGYISANENSVLFTAGPEAITLERLKNIIQDEEEKFSTYAADPGSGSISDPNLRAVIYQNGVYAHLVGSPQLSAQENDSAYASRVWLDKELPSTQVLTKVEHFIDPTDYSSGGLSVRNVYPNGKSGSIQISIQYAYFGVTLNFPVSSSSGEANGRSRSFITLVNNSIWGWNKSNYL